MTTKEKIIRQSLAKVEKRLSEIVFILDATPLIDVINLRKEGQGLLEKDRLNKDFPTKAFSEKMSEFAAKEKELFALAEKQKDTVKLIKERVKLDSEKQDLMRELWYIEKK